MHKIDKALVKMVYLDYEPFSIVERKGIKNLFRRDPSDVK